MRARRFVTTPALSALLLLVPCAPAGAQTPDQADEPTSEREFHPNHFGGFLGLSARTGVDELAPTLGLEYARVFSRHWAAVGYVELVSSQLERDIIVAVGGIYYPVRGLGIVAAVGAEGAEDENDETELAFLMRAGIAYGFRLTEAAALGPTILADRVHGSTTFVFGLAMVVGF